MAFPYARRVITSRVGGMAEQGIGWSSVRLVEDDAALVDATRTAMAELGDAPSWPCAASLARPVARPRAAASFCNSERRFAPIK